MLRQYKKVAIIDLGTDHIITHKYDKWNTTQFPDTQYFEIDINNIGFTPTKIYINAYIRGLRINDENPGMCELNKEYKTSNAGDVYFKFILSENKITLKSRVVPVNGLEVNTYVIPKIIAIE